MPCCVLSIVDAVCCWGASIDVVTFMVKGLPQHIVMLELGIFRYCIFQQNSSHLCCISSCFKKRINIKVNGWCGVQAILKTQYRQCAMLTPDLLGDSWEASRVKSVQGAQSCPKSSKACPAQNQQISLSNPFYTSIQRILQFDHVWF